MAVASLPDASIAGCHFSPAVRGVDAQRLGHPCPLFLVSPMSVGARSIDAVPLMLRGRDEAAQIGRQTSEVDILGAAGRRQLELGHRFCETASGERRSGLRVSGPVFGCFPTSRIIAILCLYLAGWQAAKRLYPCAR